MTKEILDLGCANAKHGTVNLDGNPFYKPDIVAEMHSTPFKDEAFDECILSHVIEHSEEATKLMLEVRRILKTDGVVHITVPNFASFAVLIDWLKKKPDYSQFYLLGQRTNSKFSYWEAHKQLFTPSTLKAMLTSQGFAIVKSHGCPPQDKSKILRTLGSFLVTIFPDRAGIIEITARKK